MTTDNNQSDASACGKRVTVLAGFVLLLIAPFVGWAGSTFDIKLDTTSLVNQTGVLTFDLIKGDNDNDSTVTVSGFNTDGAFVFGGNPSVTLNSPTWASAMLDSAVLDFTFGMTLNFSLDLAWNIPNYVPVTPDLVVFSIFNDTTSWVPLYHSTDPSGAGALFSIEIPSDNSAVYVPSSNGGISGTLTPQLATTVPDAGNSIQLLLLSFGSIGIVGLIRRY